jgi:hypothetical protein
MTFILIRFFSILHFFVFIFVAAAAAERRRFVFVVAVGRSGSTLLMRLLNTAPGVCVRGENNALLESLYDAAESAAMARRHSLANTTWRESWHGYERSDPTAFFSAILDAFVANVLRCPHNATTIGFKEIHTGWRARRFIEFALGNDGLPDALFVFNRRNVTSIAQSRTRIHWTEQTSADALVQTFAYFARIATQHPRRAIVVDYDEYTRTPLPALQRLFAFLGVEMNANGILEQLRRQVN